MSHLMLSPINTAPSKSKQSNTRSARSAASPSRLFDATAATKAKQRDKIDVHSHDTSPNEDQKKRWVKYAADSPSSPSKTYAWDQILHNKTLRKRLKQKLAGKLINDLKPKPSVATPHGLTQFKFSTAMNVVKFISKAKHQLKSRRLLEVREKLLLAIEEEEKYENLEDRPVVTVLKEGEHVSITKQADVDMYSNEAIMQRESLAMDDELIFNIHQWWRGMKKTESGCISKDTYIKMACIISSLLVPDGTEEERQQIAEDDWHYDAEGKEEMDVHQFTKSIFILADHWCISTKREEYVGFVRAVATSTSQKALKNGLDIMREYKQYGFDYQDYLAQLKMESRLKEKKRRERAADRRHKKKRKGTDNQQQAPPTSAEEDSPMPLILPDDTQLSPDDKLDVPMESDSARLNREDRERQDIFERAQLEEENLLRERHKELNLAHDVDESTTLHITPSTATENGSTIITVQHTESNEAIHDSHKIEDEMEEDIVEDTRNFLEDDDEEHSQFLERIRRENEEIERLRAWRKAKELSIQRLLEEEQRRRQQLLQEGNLTPDDDPELTRIQELLQRSRVEVDESLIQEKRLKKRIAELHSAERLRRRASHRGSTQKQNGKRIQHIKKFATHGSNDSNQMQQLTGDEQLSHRSPRDLRNGSGVVAKVSQFNPELADDKRPRGIETFLSTSPSERWALPQGKRAPKVRAGVSSTVTILKVANDKIAGAEEKQIYREIEQKSNHGGDKIQESNIPQERLVHQQHVHGGLIFLTPDVALPPEEKRVRTRNRAHSTSGAPSLGIPISGSFEAFPYRAPLGKKIRVHQNSKSFDGGFIQNSGLLLAKRTSRGTMLQTPTGSLSAMGSNNSIGAGLPSQQPQGHTTNQIYSALGTWKNQGELAVERRRRSLSPGRSGSLIGAAPSMTQLGGGNPLHPMPSKVLTIDTAPAQSHNENPTTASSPNEVVEATNGASEWNYTLRVRGKRF